MQCNTSSAVGMPADGSRVCLYVGGSVGITAGFACSLPYSSCLHLLQVIATIFSYLDILRGNDGINSEVCLSWKHICCSCGCIVCETTLSLINTTDGAKETISCLCSCVRCCFRSQWCCLRRCGRKWLPCSACVLILETRCVKSYLILPFELESLHGA